MGLPALDIQTHGMNLSTFRWNHPTVIRRYVTHTFASLVVPLRRCRV
jgi:hypothetical protein